MIFLERSIFDRMTIPLQLVKNNFLRQFPDLIKSAQRVDQQNILMQNLHFDIIFKQIMGTIMALVRPPDIIKAKLWIVCYLLKFQVK